MSKQRNTPPQRQARPNRRYRRLLPTVIATATLAAGAGGAPPAIAKPKHQRGTVTSVARPSLHQT